MGSNHHTSRQCSISRQGYIQGASGLGTFMHHKTTCSWAFQLIYLMKGSVYTPEEIAKAAIAYLKTLFGNYRAQTTQVGKENRARKRLRDRLLQWSKRVWSSSFNLYADWLVQHPQEAMGLSVVEWFCHCISSAAPSNLDLKLVRLLVDIYKFLIISDRHFNITSS